MASRGTEELERPVSVKSPVWEHFDFPVKYNDEGKRLVDKTVTVCRHCGTRKPYDSGNTSSMATYVKRHHPGVSLTGVKTKAAQQPLITTAFTKLCLFVLSFFSFFFLLIWKSWSLIRTRANELLVWKRSKSLKRSFSLNCWSISLWKYIIRETTLPKVA